LVGILIVSGILIIIWSLYSSYSIFTAKTKAPEIFKTQNKEIVSQNTLNKTKPANAEELQKEMEQKINDQLANIIPSNFISQLFNLISWSIFVAILILGGGKISVIGITILKG